jgi:hypothetical protein
LPVCQCRGIMSIAPNMSFHFPSLHTLRWWAGNEKSTDSLPVPSKIGVSSMMYFSPLCRYYRPDLGVL